MSQYAIALCIHGLRDPFALDNASAIVFNQGDLTGGLAASIAAVLPGANLRGLIAPIKGQVSGFGWQADPRNPIGEAQPIRVKLRDVQGALGPLFCEDLGILNSTFSYPLKDNEISRTQTSIVVYGDTPPSVGHVYWINEEAVEIEAVITTSIATQTLTVARGACGSRPRRHRLKPRTYVDGIGLLQRQYLTSRPDFDRQKFPVTIWQQTVDGNTGQAVVTWRRGYVTARPKPTGDSYEVVVEDFTKLLKSAVIGNGRKEVQIATSINVYQALAAGYVGSNGSSLNGNAGFQTVDSSLGAAATNVSQGVQPKLVEFYLNVEEAEKIFGPVLHVGTENALDATATAAFLTDIASGLGDVSGVAALRFLVDSGGWVGVFRLTSAERLSNGYGPSGTPAASEGLEFKLVIRGELFEVYEGSLGDDNVAQQVNGVVTANPSALTSGFSTNANEPVPAGSEGPKITLEWDFKGVSFPLAALYWLMSDQAKAGDLNGVYDVLPCWAVDFDPLAFDIGTAGDPMTIDSGTSEFLKLAQLQPQTFTYPIRMGDKLGDWLQNEALRAIVLWSANPTTGKFGFRQMLRAYVGGAAELAAEVGTPESVVYPGNRLPPLNQIRVELGYIGKDRAAQDYRVLVLQDGINDALSVDNVFEQKIKFWRRGNFAAQSSVAAALPRLANWYFSTLRRAPAVYKVPTSIARGAHRGADFVLWSNPKIQNVLGRGFSSIASMVVGVDNDYASGREYLLLLPYALPLLAGIAGKKAPVLTIIAIEPINPPLQWRVFVSVIGVPALQNITTAFDSFYTSMIGEQLRLETPSKHNPSPGTKERRGKLEASALIQGVGSNNSGLNWLDIRIAANWQRLGAIDIEQDLLVIDKARLLISDWRPSTSNPSGGDIYPANAQGPAAAAYVVYAPGQPEQPLHNTYYLYQ